MELFGDRIKTVSWAIVSSRRAAAAVLLLGTALAAVALALGPTPRTANGPTSALPDDAESTQVAKLQSRFETSDVAPALVVFDRRGRPLTQADRDLLRQRASELASQGVGRAVPVRESPDGTAALVAIPLRLGASDLSEDVAKIRAIAKADLPPGLRAHVTGAPAYDADLSAVFDGADANLLLTTVGVVAVLLLLTYRSPVLWVVPLAVVGLADQVSVRLLGVATQAFGFNVDEAITGITSVLVFGAGTNYALLLIARYREELRRHEDRSEAMTAALRQAAPAIVASSSTVVLALLTLSFGRDPFDRALGYAGALGIATAVVAALTLLPAALVLCGRWLFWPVVPRPGQHDPAAAGVWARVARTVGRRPSSVLAGSAVLLTVLCAMSAGIHLGLSPDEQFRETPEAVTGQRALARAFPAGSSEPTVIIAPASRALETAGVANKVTGVVSVRRTAASDGLVALEAVLGSARGSAGASATVARLRAELPPGALVGGAEAEDVDARAAAVHDQRLVVPAILSVVVLVLLLLLRSVVAAVVLVLTVVATYVAALGAGWWLCSHVLGLPAFDLGVPLLTFLFLVALGVDYNIFLSTRTREETRQGTTADAMASALAVTGGVITSAGILLAAVFAVLGVLPVVTLTQIGVVVGLGVLLDTLLVRSLVVPALVTVLGDRFWWPGDPRAAGRRPRR